MSGGAVLTQDILTELFIFDAEISAFRWINSVGRGTKAGDIAGSINKCGYRVIGIKGKLYYAHRLIWCWINGNMPIKHIDHKNGVKADNSIENLREATMSENNRNVTARSNNKSGHKGVYFDKCRGKWKAQCTLSGKSIHLGRHATAEIASAAYKEFAMAAHGEFYRTQDANLGEQK